MPPERPVDDNGLYRFGAGRFQLHGRLGPRASCAASLDAPVRSMLTPTCSRRMRRTSRMASGSFWTRGPSARPSRRRRRRGGAAIGDHAVGRLVDAGRAQRADDRVELDRTRRAAAAACSRVPSGSASRGRASRCWSATGGIAASRRHPGCPSPTGREACGCWSGSEIRLVPTRPTTPRDMSEPRCGVARKTTRLTNGSGSKKKYRRSSSRTSRAPRMSSNGRSEYSRQNWSPLETAMVRLKSPPMLCPSRTIWSNAGSRPSGSYICLA